SSAMVIFSETWWIWRGGRSESSECTVTLTTPGHVNPNRKRRGGERDVVSPAAVFLPDLSGATDLICRT
ncbi:hypothetical protein U1Q18_010471, partial [Sarracenia purpurea var. burkii]